MVLQQSMIEDTHRTDQRSTLRDVDLPGTAGVFLTCSYDNVAHVASWERILCIINDRYSYICTTYFLGWICTTTMQILRTLSRRQGGEDLDDRDDLDDLQFAAMCATFAGGRRRDRDSLVCDQVMGAICGSI